MRKKIKVHSLILWAFLENTCFMYISMENGPVEGAITCTVKHKKVYYSKMHPNFFFFFSGFCRKCQATIPEHN